MSALDRDECLRGCADGIDERARQARGRGEVFGTLNHEDGNGEVAARYVSLRKLGPFRFARRNTFLIDPDGRVSTVYVGVNAAKNAQDVSDTLRQLATT